MELSNEFCLHQDLGPDVEWYIDELLCILNIYDMSSNESRNLFFEDNNVEPLENLPYYMPMF